MSFDLIYSTAFIKVKDSFVPMELCGASNCYDNSWRSNKLGRRSRNFSHHEFGILTTKELLLKDIEKQRAELMSRCSDYSDKSFGWYSGIAVRGNSTRRSTYSMYKNFYLNGIKKAMTIEELALNNVWISIKTGWTSTKENVPPVQFLRYPKNTDEFYAMMVEAEHYHANYPKARIVVEYTNSEDMVLNVFKRFHKKA